MCVRSVDRCTRPSQTQTHPYTHNRRNTQHASHLASEGERNGKIPLAVALTGETFVGFMALLPYLVDGENIGDGNSLCSARQERRKAIHFHNSRE